MDIIAQEINKIINESNPHVFQMLSTMGKALFFPKGILSQRFQAKDKSINATIGIAKEGNRVLGLPCITKYINNIDPDNYLSYAPSFGIPELRRKWKIKIYEKNPSLKNKTISLPVVTSGITHGVSILSDMWVDKNDVIIMPDMMWDTYNMIFCVRNNGRIVHYKAYDDQLTKYNIDSFEKTVQQQSEKNDKIITILNFPHNPTGYSLNVSEADRIADILINIAQKGTHVIAGCDDAYFGLFYEEQISKESMFAKLAGSDKRLIAVKLDGATKEDYVWGFRIGFITYGIYGDNDDVLTALEQKTGGCILGNISNCSHLSQTILLKSMSDAHYKADKQEKFNLLKQRALKVKQVLKDPKFKQAFDIYPFNSGYFMCIRLKNVDAEELRNHLLENYGIALMALGDKNIRIAFSCIEESDVETVFDIILKGISG